MPTYARGLKPTPRHKLAAARSAVERLKDVSPPDNFATVCEDYDMAGNDQYGDCVTAEEVNAKKAYSVAMGGPEIEISGNEAVNWARAHGVLDGANIADVLSMMQTDPLTDVSGKSRPDGPHAAIDWTSQDQIKAAIYTDKVVKIGVAADQLQESVSTTAGSSGWILFNAKVDTNVDHCTGLHGYGTASWLIELLARALGTPMLIPEGLSPDAFCVLMYTWKTVGIVEWKSLQSIMVMGEAWVRHPGDTIFTPTPTPAPIPPTPTPVPPSPGPGPSGLTILEYRADILDEIDAVWAGDVRVENPIERWTGSHFKTLAHEAVLNTPTS